MKKKLLIVIVLVAMGALSIAAQESPTDDATPSFFIETISVGNHRKFPPGIIIAKSLLLEERSYTEAELREAVDRIVRLPLVLDADFELRKGTERNKYELVIHVTEARRWFIGLDNGLTLWRPDISVDGLELRSNTRSDTSFIGYRVPIASDGLFFVTAGGSDGGFQLGYTQYDLFNRSIILSLKFATADCDEVRAQSEPGELGNDGCATEIFDLGLDPTSSTWTMQSGSFRTRLNLAIPIGGNRTIRWLSAYRESDFGFKRSAFDPSFANAFNFRDRKELDTSLAWVLNTEDDSILPTRGRFVEAGLSYRSIEADLLDRFFPFEATAMDTSELRAQFAGQRHWPVSPKITLSAGIEAFLGRSRIRNLPLENGEIVSDDLDVWGGKVSFQHSLFLVQVYNGKPNKPHRRPRWRELRWENRLQGFFSGTSPDFDQPDNPFQGFRVDTGLVYRNTWGVFRYTLSYQDISGR